MRGIFISYRREDAEGQAGRLFDDLSEHFGRNAVFMDVAGIKKGLDFRRVIEEHVSSCGVLLVIIGKRWLSVTDGRGKRRLDDPNDFVRLETAAALSRGIPVVPVLVQDASMPTENELPDTLKEIAFRNGTELTHARWDSDVKLLIEDISPYLATPAPAPTATQTMDDYTVDTSYTVDAAVPSASGRSGVLGSVLDRFRGWWRGPRRIKADVTAPERVLLGASAPRQCAPGQRFAAVLVAYIEAARSSAKEKLEVLGEPGHRVVMDVAPQRSSSWRLGAPVTVRLTGAGLEVTPTEVRFEWNGRENLASFAARVLDDAPSSVSLCFEVFVADVPVSFISMRLSVGQTSGPRAVHQVQESVPSSAFASYSAKDAEPVTQRLSALQRWSPMLDIFQDCLDLRPSAAFQPQLREQISRRDVFLLFWSRNAAASPWVKWEYQTACETRGLSAILPMPLEDVSIAPPPPELTDRHLRDRFMLAGYGLAKIREEAKRGRQFD